MVQDVGASKLIDVAHNTPPHLSDVLMILWSVFGDQHALAHLQELPHLPHRTGQLRGAERGQAGQGWRNRNFKDLPKI